MTIFFLVSVFLFLILIGAPVAIALGGSVILVSYFMDPMPIAIIGQKIFSNLDHFTLMAVPFFFFAAALMETGGLVKRLVELANSLVGHWTGGLGVTTVLSCCLFASISGSSPATVAAVGKLMYPALIREGYKSRYALGAIVTAGSIGILIPPSIPMIIYGFVTETSVSRLFIAGVIPGIIYATGMMIMARYLAKKDKNILRPKASWKKRLETTKAALPALLLPVIIIFGIYGFPEFKILNFEYEGGAVFTPTEASIIATLLAIIIGIYVYKELSFKTAVETMVKTAPSAGMIFFITTNALLFAYFITKIGIPQAVTNFILALDMPQWLFLLLINFVFLIIGFFLEGVPVVLMFVPVLFPAAMEMGVDPIHFGIIVVLNIELGLVTPPVGLNLFVGSAITNQPIWEVFRGALPWMIVTIITLFIVTYIPSISTYLPNLFYK
jgi:C4-dicarboxylate transporter, DctM subunit